MMGGFPAVVRVVLAVAMSAGLAFTSSSAASASSTTSGLGGPAPMDPWLTEQLADAAPGDTHGTGLRAAHVAAARAGLTPRQDLERIGVTIASGSPQQVELAARQPGVTYVEGDQPLVYHMETSHDATRGAQAAAKLAGARGAALNGAWVSVAIIDTGVDPTHPFFREPDGSSAVVANLKNTCGSPTSDPDTSSLPPGTHRVWARACLGDSCGTHARDVQIGQ